MQRLNLPIRLNNILCRAVALFTLILIETAGAGVPVTVDESSVSFFPPIHLKSGSECQGTRIAKQLVVTSPLCTQAIQNQAANSTTRILDSEGKAVGSIMPVEGIQSLTPEDQEMLLDVSDASSNEFDTYPALRNSDTPPAAAYAYLKRPKPRAA